MNTERHIELKNQTLQEDGEGRVQGVLAIKTAKRVADIPVNFLPEEEEQLLTYAVEFRSVLEDQALPIYLPAIPDKWGEIEEETYRSTLLIFRTDESNFNKRAPAPIFVGGESGDVMERLVNLDNLLGNKIKVVPGSIYGLLIGNHSGEFLGKKDSALPLEFYPAEFRDLAPKLQNRKFEKVLPSIYPDLTEMEISGMIFQSLFKIGIPVRDLAALLKNIPRNPNEWLDEYMARLVDLGEYREIMPLMKQLGR